MSTLELFGYYRSSASYRIRIVLNLKNLPWTGQSVQLPRGEQKTDAFMRRNPSGLVPVLDTGTVTLSQSAAIAEYLEERYPEVPLLPGDAMQRARIREMMAIVGCDIHPLQNLRVLNHLRENLHADKAAVSRWVHRWIGSGFEAFEAMSLRHGGNGPFALGAAVTLADAWLVPQVYNAMRYDLDLAPFPRINSIYSHCLTLPAFSKAAPERQPDATA